MALQGLQLQLERADNLCAVLDCYSASPAASLASSSIPRAALVLAAHLESARSPEATERVGEQGLVVGCLPDALQQVWCSWSRVFFRRLSYSCAHTCRYACRPQPCGMLFPATCWHWRMPWRRPPTQLACTMHLTACRNS